MNTASKTPQVTLNQEFKDTWLEAIKQKMKECETLPRSDRKATSHCINVKIKKENYQRLVAMGLIDSRCGANIFLEATMALFNESFQPTQQPTLNVFITNNKVIAKNVVMVQNFTAKQRVTYQIAQDELTTTLAGLQRETIPAGHKKALMKKLVKNLPVVAEYYDHTKDPALRELLMVAEKQYKH